MHRRAAGGAELAAAPQLGQKILPAAMDCPHLGFGHSCEAVAGADAVAGGDVRVGATGGGGEGVLTARGDAGFGLFVTGGGVLVFSCGLLTGGAAGAVDRARSGKRGGKVACGAGWELTTTAAMTGAGDSSAVDWPQLAQNFAAPTSGALQERHFFPETSRTNSPAALAATVGDGSLIDKCCSRSQAT
jgi:hypothetical protein